MDELKNLMIQTLEANGILGQLRAQIRCSVFKIIDNQDDMENMNPRQRAKSALHWENQKARDCLTQHGAISLLVAELVRDYLEFYSLDYTNQIFMPESGLGAVDQRPRVKLAEDSKIHGANDSKPLLLSLLEKFVSGDLPSGSQMTPSQSLPDKNSDFKLGKLVDKHAKGSASAAKPAGIEFSDDKVQRSQGSTSGPAGNSAGGFPPASMGIGEGILQNNQTKQTPTSSEAKLGGAAESSSSPEARQSSSGHHKPAQKHELNLEKATSLLDEVSREEKTGFKAEIGNVRFGQGGVMKQDSSDQDLNARASNIDQHKKSSPEFDESNYEEDFEEIDEDLPDDNIIGADGSAIDQSGGSNQYAVPKIGESHGITVSQSLGIDPSVDSLQLEEYDHIEEVDQVGH